MRKPILKNSHKFPSIVHLKDVKKTLAYIVGKNPQFAPLIAEYGINYCPTVKLHGTNAGIMYDARTDDFTALSRNRVLTIEQDNYNFALWVSQLNPTAKQELISLMDAIDCNILYGEWAGKGINHGDAICNVERGFYIFCGYNTETEHYVTYDLKNFDIALDEFNIYNIYDFPIGSNTNLINIRFDSESDELILNTTRLLEQACPVAATFNSEGHGEGIVWIPASTNIEDFNIENILWDLAFKTKTTSHQEKHDSPSKMGSTKDFAQETKDMNHALLYCTEARMLKGIEAIKEIHILRPEDLDRKHTGKYIQYIQNDISKEEDVNANVVKKIGHIAREWYFDYLNKS